MLLNRYNTDVGSDALPTYLPSADELAIMALGPSRWFEARTDRGLLLDDTGAVKAWVDRARGTKYVPLSELPDTAGSGATRPVIFTGSATKAMVAEEASDAFGLATTYTVAVVVKLAASGSGGSPLGTAADGTSLAFVWFNVGVNAGLTYFTRGQASNTLASPAANNDNTWHVFLVSIDTTQATQADRYRMRKNGASIGNAGGNPLSIADAPGSKRVTLGGAGRGGQIAPFIGELGAALVIPDIALHLPANADQLALVESYLAAFAATLP